MASIQLSCPSCGLDVSLELDPSELNSAQLEKVLTCANEHRFRVVLEYGRLRQVDYYD